MTIDNSIYKLCGDALRKESPDLSIKPARLSVEDPEFPPWEFWIDAAYRKVNFVLRCTTNKSWLQNTEMKINIWTGWLIFGLPTKKFPPWEFLCIKNQYHHNKQGTICLLICHNHCWSSARSNNIIVWLKWKYFAAGVQIPTVGIWSFDKQGTWIIWIIFALFKWYYCSSRSIHLT